MVVWTRTLDIRHSREVLDILHTAFELFSVAKGTCDIDGEVWDFVLCLLIEMGSSGIRCKLRNGLKKTVLLCWL